MPVGVIEEEADVLLIFFEVDVENDFTADDHIVDSFLPDDVPIVIILINDDADVGLGWMLLDEVK